jgi:hypothetical protein
VTVDAKGRVTSGSATINTTDVEDGTIANADISGTAAIASSKISFAADSVSGNAVDGLTGGGDYGITNSGGFDHHSSTYYHLNSGCAGHYFASYSHTATDSDAGYEAPTALGDWAASGGCNAAEGGAFVFYAATR